MTTKHTQSIEITGDETCRLAEELAELRGESMAKAVDSAVRLAVEQERANKETVRSMFDRGCSSDEVEAAIQRPLTQRDMDHWLYDDDGLPRGQNATRFDLTDIEAALSD